MNLLSNSAQVALALNSGNPNPNTSVPNQIGPSSTRTPLQDCQYRTAYGYVSNECNSILYGTKLPPKIDYSGVKPVGPMGPNTPVAPPPSSLPSLMNRGSAVPASMIPMLSQGQSGAAVVPSASVPGAYVQVADLTSPQPLTVSNLAAPFPNIAPPPTPTIQAPSDGGLACCLSRSVSAHPMIYAAVLAGAAAWMYRSQKKGR
jgi:hypothetical protein